MAAPAQVKRRPVRTRRGLLVAAAFIAVVLLAGLLSVDHYRAPAPAPPSALDRVAEKNRKAAVIAAAHQRAEAAAATNSADNLVNVQDVVANRTAR